MRNLVRIISGVTLCAVVTAPALAATYYVDNLAGDDVFDGSAAEPTGKQSGPMRTIGRALEQARNGDRIVIANRDRPYYESISLTGARMGASGGRALEVQGNGAIISGARPVPPESWEQVNDHLWRFAPRRKGHYLLLHKEQAVPEFPSPQDRSGLKDLPPGEWTAFEGSIYYHAVAFQSPPGLPFSFAAENVGLTLYNVRQVVVRDLTFRHFRLDGVNAPDSCRDILLEGVRAVENGRAGLAVGGSSQVVMQGGELQNNRRENILVTGRATAQLDDTLLDAASEPSP